MKLNSVRKRSFELGRVQRQRRDEHERAPRSAGSRPSRSGATAGACARAPARAERCVSEVIAAPVMCSSVMSSPSSVRTAWPREKTMTRSHRPCSSTTSEETTITACPPGRRGAAPGRARAARWRRRRAWARRPAARSAPASSERANSTFCWLPPESAETGVSIDGVRTSSCLICAGHHLGLAPALDDARRGRRRRARAARRSRARSAAAARPRRGGRRAGGRCPRAAPCRDRRATRASRPASPCRSSAAVPASARRNSRCPLPSTPASPTISPGRTSRSTSWKRGPGEPAHAQQRLAVRGELGLGRKCLVDGAADDEAQDLRLRDARRGHRAARLAVAQHRDAVGDALHLGQAVRDVDDGRARGRDRAHLLEQQLALDGRQRLGRLVEHEHLRLERQRLGDLDELAIGHAQLADPRRRIDRAGADDRELLARPRARAQQRRPPCRAASRRPSSRRP